MCLTLKQYWHLRAGAEIVEVRSDPFDAYHELSPGDSKQPATLSSKANTMLAGPPTNKIESLLASGGEVLTQLKQGN